LNIFCKGRLHRLCLGLSLRLSLILGLGLVMPAAAEMLKVGIYEAPPLVFDKKSPLLGIYKEIFVEISKLTSDTFEFEENSAGRTLDAFNAGKIDIEPGINPIWRKNQLVPGLYSVPFAKSETVLVSLPGSKENRRFLRTGRVVGYEYPELEDQYAKQAWLTVVAADERGLFDLLNRKKADQILMQSQVARYWLDSGRIRKPERYELSEPVEVQDIMMRVHPNKASAIPRLNKAIKTLLDNGTIQKIYEHYIHKNAEPKTGNSEKSKESSGH